MLLQSWTNIFYSKWSKLSFWVKIILSVAQLVTTVPVHNQPRSSWIKGLPQLRSRLSGKLTHCVWNPRTNKQITTIGGGTLEAVYSFFKVKKEAEIFNQCLKRSWLIQMAVVQCHPLINDWVCKYLIFFVTMGFILVP